MSNLLDTCTDCFEIKIPFLCNNNLIVVKAALTPFTDYIAVFTTKFGKQYVSYATSDTHGFAGFDVSTFPAGVIDPQSGTLTLQIKKTQPDCAPENLTFCGKTYTCVSLTFINSQDANQTQMIVECGCDATAFVPCTNTSVPSLEFVAKQAPTGLNPDGWIQIRIKCPKHNPYVFTDGSNFVYSSTIATFASLPAGTYTYSATGADSVDVTGTLTVTIP